MSARPFVVAAVRAGYAVTAIDAFADMQTVAAAEKAMVVNCGEYGFKADVLLAVIEKLDSSQYLGFVYGSGFEAQPDLLEKIAAIIPLIGNVSQVVAKVKSHISFFAALERCNIAYPKVYEALPADVDSNIYLKKLAGGCGGTYISFAKADNYAKSLNQDYCQQYYYQQWLGGRSVSLLFASNALSIQVIGFNEQWLSPTETSPFLYGGAVSNAALSQDIQQQLITAAEKLTVEFGLLGLNSLDAVVSGGIVYVLEINPRLSATFDLYDDIDIDADLIELHIQASTLAKLQPYQCSKVAKAHFIMYASSAIVISSDFVWPAWVVDIPQPTLQQKTRTFLAGEPVCTVLAQAGNAEKAKQLVQARLAKIAQLLSRID